MAQFEGKAPSDPRGSDVDVLVGSAGREDPWTQMDPMCDASVGGGKWTVLWVRNLPATALAVLYLGTHDNRYTAGMGKWWAWIFVRGWRVE